MADIELYTSPLCGFCHAAKRLLAAKAVDFTEIDILAEPQRKTEMIERADGRRTVPQIFIDGRAIGGCEELYDLERTGELDRLLAGAEA